MFTNNEKQIVLENGESFRKELVPTFPVPFTRWVSNVELTPAGKPEMKKPVRGKRRWKNLPQLIVTV